MPLNIVFGGPQHWSRLNPYYSSTITLVKVIPPQTLRLRELFREVHVNFALLACGTNQEPSSSD